MSPKGAIDSAAGARSGKKVDEVAGDLNRLAADLTQLCLDIAGIFDPTPVSDGASALISLARGDWLGAVLSGVGVIPYIGDLAKAGKFPKYLKTLEHAIRVAGQSADAAQLLRPIFAKLDKALDLLPDNAPSSVQEMRRLVKKFLHDFHVKPAKTAQLPDISGQFRFPKRYRQGDFEYLEASGRLGVPGKVSKHRDGKAQRRVSSHTGDHAGHLIGDRFGAPGDVRNLTPQNAYLNSYARKGDQHWAGKGGSYLHLEDYWESQLHKGVGVEVKVRDMFRPGEDRPIARLVEWTEVYPDGKRQNFSVDFLNAHTPLSRAKRNVPTTKYDQPAEVIDLDLYRRSRR